MASTVPRMRGSSGGRNPTSGNQQQAGVQRVRRRNTAQSCCGFALKPYRQTVSCTRVRSARQRSSGAAWLNCSAARIERSTATQTITLEKVKFCAPAAHLPDALVRLLPDLFQMQHQRPLQLPAFRRGHQAERGFLIDRVDQLAIDIELQLACSRRCRRAPGRRPGSRAARAPSIPAASARRRCRT